MQLTALWLVSVRFCYMVQGLTAVLLPSAMHCFMPDLYTPLSMCIRFSGIATQKMSTSL